MPSETSLFETAEVATDSPAAVEQAPAPKPSRERSPKVVTPAAIDATASVLEWLAGDDPARAAASVANSLANLDDLLVQGEFWRSMNSWLAPWAVDVHAVICMRHATAARIAWLQSRASGDSPARIDSAKPTPEEMTAHLVGGARFACFAGLSRGLTDARNAVRSGLTAINEALAIARSSYVRPAHLTGTWVGAETQIAETIAMDQRLKAKATEIDSALALLDGRHLQPHASAVVAEFGAETVGAAVEELKGKPPEIPVVSDEMRYLESQILTIDDTVRVLPAAVQQSTKASMLADLQRQYDASRESLERYRESQRLSAAQGRVGEVEAACRDFAGWREIGDLATKHPEAFPEGFAAKWLAAGRAAIESMGPKTLWDAMERIPAEEIARAARSVEFDALK